MQYNALLYCVIQDYNPPNRLKKSEIWRNMMKKQMKIEEAILYCLASQNRRTSESRIKLACILPSEEEEDEVNRGMRTEQIAEMINRQQLHIRKDGQPVTSNQVYAVICRFPEPTNEARVELN